MTIRTIIVAAVASLSFAGTGLGDWGPLPVNLSNELTAPDSGNFGYSVAIDGDTCVIGADYTNFHTGSAYVFTNTGGTWSQVQKLTATGGAPNDYFGNSVAIDGDTCVIGASGTNTGAGSAYVYGSGSGQTGVAGDLDGDGDVDADDVHLVEHEAGICHHDTNGDGITNIIDVLEVIIGWGITCH